MKLSRKSDYALRALFGLIASDRKTPVSIRELSERYDVPKRFLEQIMLELKSKGWVRSIAGRDGGFVLAKKPDEIVFFEVYKDEEALKAHGRSPHLAKLRKGFATLFHGPVEVTRLDRIGGFAR